MGSLRSELTDAQWRRLESLLPGRAGTVGRPSGDNRRFVNGVLWVLRSGMRWADLPERYGPYKSMHKRFVRWARAGIWDLVFRDLASDRANPHLMLVSTLGSHEAWLTPTRLPCAPRFPSSAARLRAPQNIAH